MFVCPVPPRKSRPGFVPPQLATRPVSELDVRSHAVLPTKRDGVLANFAPPPLTVPEEYVARCQIFEQESFERELLSVMAANRRIDALRLAIHHTLFEEELERSWIEEDFVSEFDNHFTDFALGVLFASVAEEECDERQSIDIQRCMFVSFSIPSFQSLGRKVTLDIESTLRKEMYQKVDALMCTMNIDQQEKCNRLELEAVQRRMAQRFQDQFLLRLEKLKCFTDESTMRAGIRFAHERQSDS